MKKYSISSKRVYLDFAASTPPDNAVVETVTEAGKFFANPSAQYESARKSKELLNEARKECAMFLQSKPEEIIFTSGATESNNIAILGLKNFAKQKNKKHIISSVIEHKAVLEPLEILKRNGFEIELVKPDLSGRVNVNNIIDKIRDDTLLISLMHVNNETGVIQPIDELANKINKKEILFHVDASQSYGKIIETLKIGRAHV